MMGLSWRAVRDRLMTPRLCLVLAFVTTMGDINGWWRGDADGIEEAAQELGFSRAFITNALARLVELGYLQSGVAMGAPARSYRALIDAELPPDRLRPARGGDGK